MPGVVRFSLHRSTFKNSIINVRRYLENTPHTLNSTQIVTKQPTKLSLTNTNPTPTNPKTTHVATTTRGVGNHLHHSSLRHCPTTTKSSSSSKLSKERVEHITSLSTSQTPSSKGANVNDLPQLIVHPVHPLPPDHKSTNELSSEMSHQQERDRLGLPAQGASDTEAAGSIGGIERLRTGRFNKVSVPGA